MNGGSVSVSIPSNENKDSTDKDDDVFYDSEDETEDQSDTFAWVQIRIIVGLFIYLLIFFLWMCCSSCEGCPVVKPVFLCGSDNRTYSSLCRLDYHNCIHHTSVKVSCKGFCPCKGNWLMNGYILSLFPFFDLFSFLKIQKKTLEKSNRNQLQTVGRKNNKPVSRIIHTHNTVLHLKISNMITNIINISSIPNTTT